MPMYEYRCSKCSEVVECLVPYENRQDQRPHDECGGALQYQVSGGKAAAPRYQMAGIMPDGTRVPGNFGGGYRTDTLKRKKRNNPKKKKEHPDE